MSKSTTYKIMAKCNNCLESKTVDIPKREHASTFLQKAVCDICECEYTMEVRDRG